MNLLSPTLLLVATASLAAQDNPPAAPVEVARSPVQMEAEVQIIQLPQAAALTLVPRLLAPDTVAAAWSDVQAECAAGRAHRVATLAGKGFAGIKIEQSDPSPVPASYSQDEPFSDSQTRATTAHDPLASAPYILTDREAFEIKNSLIASAGSDETAFEMYVICNRSLLDGPDRFETGVRANGQVLYALTPRIRERGNFGQDYTNTITARQGVPLLLGCWKIGEKKDTVEIQVLTARVRPTALPPISIPLNSRPPATAYHLEARWIRLPLVDALLLRPRLLSSSDAPVAMEDLQRRIVDGRAELSGWLIGTSSLDQSVSVQDIVSSVGPANEPQVQGPGNLAPPDPITERLKYVIWYRSAWIHPHDPPFWTERFGLGSSMTIYPREYHSATNELTLTCQPCKTEFQSYWRLGYGPDQFGHASYLYLPQTTRLSLGNPTGDRFAFRLRLGQPFLFSFHKVEAPANSVELLILQATATAPTPTNPPSSK